MITLLPVLLFYYNAILLGDTSTTTIRDYIVTEALIAGVNPQIAIGVAERESKFNCNAVGDHGTSHGCFQIHLPAHTDITKEQAHNIIWSTQWSIEEMKKNGCKIWSTCKDVMKTISSRDT
jgi:hypothetical protein